MPKQPPKPRGVRAQGRERTVYGAVSEADWQRLQQRKLQHGQSTAWIVAQAIEEWLERHDAGRKETT